MPCFLWDLPASYHFDPIIMREYDVRGTVGKNLSERDAFALGAAFGTYVRRRDGSRVVVGYDGRDSSIPLSDALVRGLRLVGVDVERIGLVPTPAMNFAVKDLLADGGVMITGSHNPADDNGFKMTLQHAPVFGDDIQEIAKIAEKGNFESGEGKLHDIDIREAYLDRLVRDLASCRELKIAWDAGNGSAGPLLRALTDRLPGEHVLIYNEIDSSFPNHHPDPCVDANMRDLQELVLREKCDVGFAFDGDGDRIGVVDEKGQIIRSDILLALYARSVLEEYEGAPIIGDVKCSQVLFDEITRLGGQAVIGKTGHSPARAKMVEMKAPLAGEFSGHIFFADHYYGYDDALYCAIRLMNELCDDHHTLSAMTSNFPVMVSTPEIRVEVEEYRKKAIVEGVAAALATNKSDDVEVLDIDGVRVKTSDGWWLLRHSNTQNVLTMRIESTSREGLERLKAMMLDYLSPYDVVPFTDE